MNLQRSGKSQLAIGSILKTGRALTATVATLCFFMNSAFAAPDEELLGKSKGYPVGTARNWFTDEGVRVGSFTHQAEIAGIFKGDVNEMPASSSPMPLPKSPEQISWRWNADQIRNLTPQDYLDRQRTMALLVVKDGQLVYGATNMIVMRSIAFSRNPWPNRL